jgi:quinoprotein glucose dehydrogenase
LTLGGYLGGTNWPGGSYDPETHNVIVYSQSNINTMGLVKPDPKQSDMDFIRGIAAPPAAQGLTVQGLPLVKPPYSRISAINLDRGEILWQTPHGDTPDVVRNHPALKGMTIPRTGQNGHTVGTLVTKTLVIAGDPTLTTTDTHPRGAMLRAYDKLTGKEVGAVLMPAPVSGSPMTFAVNGRQHVAIAISGGNYPGELLVFRLPAPEKPKTP